MLLVLLLASVQGWAQILTFDFAGAAGSEITLNSNANDAGLTGSTISRGSGVSSGGNADRFNSTGWTTGTVVDVNDYVQFTITPQSGKQFSISSIQFQHQRSG